MITINKIAKNFLSRTHWDHGIRQLLDSLPDIYFYIKDIKGNIIWVNHFFLTQTGFKELSQIQGKTDFDIWPSHLATSYVKDDKKVLATQRPILNRIELVKKKHGGFDWFSTSKVPLQDVEGTLMGIIGQSVFIHKKSTPALPALKMAPVVNYIMENYGQNISMENLARLIHLSVGGFERKFKKYFDITPLKFINKVRIEAACQLLADSEMNLSEIALETGFYDGSHFSKQFKAYTDLLPNTYRLKHFHR